jgi:hypothetical protein
MHPLRKLRDPVNTQTTGSGKAIAAQAGELLAENTVFNSLILARAD